MGHSWESRVSQFQDLLGLLAQQTEGLEGIWGWGQGSYPSNCDLCPLHINGSDT